MLKLSKDFRQVTPLRAALNIACRSDVRLTLDRDNRILEVDLLTDAARNWNDHNTVLPGATYDDVFSTMGGLTVESFCLL